MTDSAKTPGTTEPSPQDGQGVADISDITGDRGKSFLQALISSQPFWVSIALLMIILLMSYLQPEVFPSEANFYNMTRNFSYIGIMAIGMVAVIITGGIDLSVGSIMGVTGVVCGILLESGFDWYHAVAAGLATGVITGGINGGLIAYAGLSPFVVTLGMMSFARSIAIVLSQNRMIYDFGPHGASFKILGGGQLFGLSTIFWALVVITIVVGVILRFTTWGRHLYAIGGNEHAARLTGVPVKLVKAQAYMLSGLTASIAAILVVGWQGSAINALGTGYELRVIASTVIGGANLMGGEGGVIGAFIGAALLEVIRNSLLMQGIDSNWQGAFVGVFIVLAVLLEKIRGRRRG